MKNGIKLSTVLTFLGVLFFFVSCKKDNHHFSDEIFFRRAVADWQKGVSKSLSVANKDRINSIVNDLNYSDAGEFKNGGQTHYLIKINTPSEINNSYLGITRIDKNYFFDGVYNAKSINSIQVFCNTNELPISESIRIVDLSGHAKVGYRNSGNRNLLFELAKPRVKNKYKANGVEQDPYGPAPNCTDWYWVTYNTQTGEVVSEEFAFQTCEAPGGSGGGGSGSSGGGPKACWGSFNPIPQGAGSNVNNSKVWGIPASYMNPATGTRLQVTFGMDAYIPTKIAGWDTYNRLNSYAGYLSLWLNGDIASTSDGGYTFSSNAQKAIMADATDYASNETSRYIELGQVVSSSQYKAIFATQLRIYLARFLPGTSVNILHSDVAGTTQFSVTYGDPELCQ